MAQSFDNKNFNYQFAGQLGEYKIYKCHHSKNYYVLYPNGLLSECIFGSVEAAKKPIQSLIDKGIDMYSNA